MKKIIVVLFFTLSYNAQNSDSLITALKKAKNDLIRCEILSTLVNTEDNVTLATDYNNQLENLVEKNLKLIKTNDFNYKKYRMFLANCINFKAYLAELNGNHTAAENYYYRSYEIDKELDNKNDMATFYNSLGILYVKQGETKKALETFLKGLDFYKGIKDTSGINELLRNLGILYAETGNIKEALNCHVRGLKTEEFLGDNEAKAYTLIRLANIYKVQGETEKAINYIKSSLEILQSLRDSVGIAQAFNDLGGIYYQKNDLKNASEYYNKNYKINIVLGNKEAIAHSLYNLGIIAVKKFEHEKALNYYEHSLKLFQDIGNKSGIIYTLSSIGELYWRQKNYNAAEEYIKRSLELSSKQGHPSSIMNNAEGLFRVYEAKGNYRLALENYQLYIKMRDSINNIETQKATIKQQTQYEYDMQMAVEGERHAAEFRKQKDMAIADKRRQSIIILFVSVLLLLVIIFFVVLYKRFHVTRKQKSLIEIKEKEAQIQKHIIEEKHKEITDSINYAERIQRSLLANKVLMDKHLTEYFILFKPKDVVSGDFYWCTELNNNNFALVTADSTGHGVPGAIMSMLNIACLNEAVKEGYLMPNEILNRTRKEIINVLKRDGSVEGGKDGMDCSILCFDFKNMKLKLAAANNPVWIVRSSSNSNPNTSPINDNVVEIKPDKMPVGKHDKQDTPFTLHEIELQKGDTIYTLTDGFPDQFGGERGKKFMSKKLRELLVSNVTLPMIEQKKLLETTFENWTGDLEQIDDVTVLGIKV